MSDPRLVSAAIWSTALWATLAAGCGAYESSEAPSDSGSIHFTPLEQRSHTVESVDPPAPPTSLEEQPGYREIVEGVRANPIALFQREGIDERIGRIERVFTATGRYLELVALYQRAVDDIGYQTPAATRLGWAYVRLGQRKQAREFIERLGEERPEDPVVPFLKGALALERAPNDREAAARAVRAWRRTLELDPDFEGFGGLASSGLRRQTERLENRLGDSVDSILNDASSGSTAPGASQPAEPTPRSSATPEETSESEETTETPDESPSEPDTAAPSRPPERADTGPAPDAGRGGPTSSDAASGSPDTSEATPPVEVRITRADLAASRGNWEEAESLYSSALEDRPDSLAARIGEIKTDWHLDGDADATRSSLRDLADEHALTARKAYELARFAASELDDSDLASTLFDRVRELDPEFADRVAPPTD